MDRRTGHTDVTDGRTNGPDEQMDKNLVEEMILLIPTDEWTEQTYREGLIKETGRTETLTEILVIPMDSRTGLTDRRTDKQTGRTNK